MSTISEYIEALKTASHLAGQVVFHHQQPAREPEWGSPLAEASKEAMELCRAAGIERLYMHQTEALQALDKGQHVVLSTPTASGKSLVYNVRFIENFRHNPATRALYLFPLKALAQDQLLNFREFTSSYPGNLPTAAIYDGDTTTWQRKKIRDNPPNVLFTNPEMLHLSLLPHHARWGAFWAELDLIVIDEVHTYRGVMGSHMAQVFRRVGRICNRYGTRPQFILNSATIGNPGRLAQQLTGLSVHTVSGSGALQGLRHTLFVDPFDGPAQAAILLLKAALKRELRTIVYTQSRKLTELIALWASNQTAELAQRISAYRAGFLPEERREIEARLVKGDLLAVVSTSALELGIDIGDLDLCLLVGYPGTIMATLQRGGRVGRSGQDSAMVMIAGEDALDQYFMRHPREFFRREPEAAVINPYNPEIVAKHLVCAAVEAPLRDGESIMTPEPVQKTVAQLEQDGKLLRSADGDELYASRRAPHRLIDLRGSGSRFAILTSDTAQHCGEVDGSRALKETHPGAIYLHRGKTYLVDALDLETHTVKVSPIEANYYTRVRTNKETEILEVYQRKRVKGTQFFAGRLKVTEQVVGYDQWLIRFKKRIKRVELDLPAISFETDGLWFTIPTKVQQRTEDLYLHFMGGIHAVEHAAIGIFPLLVMTDRNDLGGISIPFHPQLSRAAVFIYDGVPGGAGLSRQAFRRATALLDYTLKVIKDCPCESGCPSCVHSPKCGSGNRPIHKQAAVFVLENLIRATAQPTADAVERPEANPPTIPSEGSETNSQDIFRELRARSLDGKTKSGADDQARFRPRRRRTHVGLKKFRVRAGSNSNSLDKGDVPEAATGLVPVLSTDTDTLSPRPIQSDRNLRKSAMEEDLVYGVLDLETQLSAAEVGGWHRADLMRVSCAVLYDSRRDRYRTFTEAQMEMLIQEMQQLPLIVGFNIQRFDYRVLSAYTAVDLNRLPTLDILQQIHQRLGYRLSLDHLARVTLGEKKSADGLQALRWWKEGRLEELHRYCRHDVSLTRRIYEYGCTHGYLLFENKAGKKVRIPVQWPPTLQNSPKA